MGNFRREGLVQDSSGEVTTSLQIRGTREILAGQGFGGGDPVHRWEEGEGDCLGGGWKLPPRPAFPLHPTPYPLHPALDRTSPKPLHDNLYLWWKFNKLLIEAC